VVENDVIASASCPAPVCTASATATAVRYWRSAQPLWRVSEEPRELASFREIELRSEE
jgi:hypothetical protein